ncbi:hypothetical protein P7C71_g5340, partial [Lecanoromycetidae sp. Uapishka_2]
MVLSTIVYSIGILTCFSILFKLFNFIHLHTRASSLPRYRQKPNSWALVTGSSDGIGLAIAKELASNSFNVILHGRNPTKLENLKKQLSHDFPKIEFLSLVLDASSALSEEQISESIRLLQNLHLTVLVNNVGGTEAVMNPAVRPFSEHSRQDIDKIFNLNTIFASQLIRALWPMLLKNTPSLIMNISSAASIGFPYCTVYSGCKAYIESFTRALYAEAHAEINDVEVLGIVVGKVTNVGHRKEPVSFATPDARTMARAALGKVGCGNAVVSGYWVHALQVAGFGILPEWMLVRVMGMVMRGLEESNRKEQMRKMS